jgi:hypothetical protein
VYQYIWGCRETVTGSDVSNMPKPGDGEERGTGLRTATKVHNNCVHTVRISQGTVIIKYHSHVGKLKQSNSAKTDWRKLRKFK